LEDKETRKRWKLRQQQNKLDIEAIANTDGGAYLLWRILKECGLYQMSFDRQPGELAFHEGKRYVGLWLLRELTGADEKLYSRIREIGYLIDKGEKF
jgi:hypothetical protein